MSKPTMHRRLRTTLALMGAAGTLLGVATTARADGDQAAAPGPESKTVVIGPEYEAGAYHRWLWGKDYRALWTTPIRVDVLDLGTVAGGLKPVRRVGGRETKALAFTGADGRAYTFRGI